ncbi:MAG: hypothetical protein IJ849_06280 [Selenomonadaceae bacterium]|nr:hypothetical protein [Selenomonadaceae bacterium]
MSSAANDTIEFRLTGYCYGPDIFPTPTVEIYINGENFRNKVNSIEHIFAVDEGHPEITGHATITPRELYDSLHDDYLRFDSVSIFGCGCGVIECWPLDVAVDVGAKTVSWYGFNMYHRTNWDYSDLGKYVFYKQQYFQEVDKLLLFEKQGQEIVENFQVGFDVQEHGWVKMHMSLEGKRCITNLSYLFSPFDDLLNMLKRLESDSSSEQVKIDEEGVYTNICVEESNDVLSVTVVQENADTTPNGHYSCETSRENFILAFKWAFQILEDEGFDPNFWDEHEPGYPYDEEDEVNPREVLESFWKDEWFQFLREP